MKSRNFSLVELVNIAVSSPFGFRWLMDYASAADVLTDRSECQRNTCMNTGGDDCAPPQGDPVLFKRACRRQRDYLALLERKGSGQIRRSYEAAAWCG